MLMSRIVVLAILANLASVAWTPSNGQTPPPSVRKVDPATLAMRDVPAFAGVSNGFIEGAFDKSGLYAASSRMMKGSKFPPHSHPDMRLTVVVAGTMYLGEGDTFDESKLVAYPAGTVAVTPANTFHYMYAKDNDVIALEIGSGPSGAAFVKK